MNYPILASKKRSELEMVYDLLWHLRRGPLARTRAVMLANITWTRGDIFWAVVENAGLVEKVMRSKITFHRGGPGNYHMILTEKGHLFLNHIEAARKLLLPEPYQRVVVAE